MELEREIVFFPWIIRFIWRQNKKDLEKVVKQTLARFFSIKGRKIFLSFKQIYSLEEAFASLKRFSGFPETAVLPFSLVPSQYKNKPFLRPGKIYLTSQEKKQWEKEKIDLPFLVQIVPWLDLYELQIPSTLDPKLLFKYRDLLLVGPFKPCLHCGLPWHETMACPGRKEIAPWEALKEFLHFSLRAIGEELNQAFEKFKDKESQKVLFKLFLRYPYLLPAFLRILFISKGKTWDNFNFFPQKILVPGGQLFLALEALIKGDLKEAQKRFEKSLSSREWRASLGLAFVSMEKKNLSEALYHVESALSEAERPLIRSYLLFLKGWLFENKGDSLKAEESYKEALRTDRLCFPARFHYRTFSTKYGLWEDIWTHLPALSQHPLGFLLLFLEARFLPLAPRIEASLEERFKSRQMQAVSRLVGAENNLRPILKLLPEEEAEELQQSLNTLREKIYKGGYWDFLEAEEQGMVFSLEAQGLLYRQIRKVRSHWKDLKQKYQEYENFWRLKGEKDSGFKVWLDKFSQGLKEIERALATNPHKNLKFCSQKLKALEEMLPDIEKAQEELLQRLKFKYQLRTFIKTFLSLELILFLFFLLFPWILHFWNPYSEKPSFISPGWFVIISLCFLGFSIFKALGQKK